MKANFLLIAILFCSTLQVLAQEHPLVGTWEAISVKGTGSDGAKISATGAQYKETKIITPTHYILITHKQQGDTYLFDKAIAGTVRLEGNKYIETPMYFSQEETGKTKTNFTYKLEGDKFIQSGTITAPDNKITTVDALVFKRVKGNNAAANPAIGTWNQLSSKGVDAEGKVLWSHTNATHTRFQIISPEYWMRMSLYNNQFENATGGTYRMEGNKVYPDFEMTPNHPATEITQLVIGDKLYWKLVLHGSWHGADSKITVEDVFERVTPSILKVIAVK